MRRINHSSRFIEMFGNPVTNTKSWPTKALSEVAPESPSTNKATGLVWVLNLDMVESQSGRVIEKVYDNVENLNSVAPFDDGNVLFSKLRPYLNKVVIPNGKGYATTELVPLRPNTTFVRKEFLACLLRSNDFVNYADAIATGTKMPRMPMTALRDFKCIIPPADLQDEFIKVSQQADKSKFSDFKSRFIEMFGNAEKTMPLSDCIGITFPGEWGEDDSDGTGVKVIRTTNFTNSGKLDLTNVVTRKIDPAKIDKKHLIPGDIILERSGGTADNPVGRVVYFEAKGTFLFNNFTQLLRCKDGVNSLFVFYSLYNYYHTHKSEIRSLGNKTTGIQNLKMDKYWDIPIADASHEQQDQFVSLYKQADKSKYLN